MKRLATLLCLLLAAPAAFADATLPTRDIDGGKDAAWLQRYEGSFIVSQDHRAYDEVTFPASKLERSADPEERDQNNNAVFRAKENRAVGGEYSRLVYVAPAGRSPLEVLRNYQDVITDAGGKTVYECAGAACGGDIHGNAHGGGWQGLMEQIYPGERMKDEPFSNGSCTTSGTPSEQRYALATMPDGHGGERTLGIYTFGIQADTYCKALNGLTGIIVVAVSPRERERRMVTVTADTMAQALDADGKIALYGIQFDTNKSTLKPESRETVAQIAELLKAHPTLSLDVVGHTDDVGGADANLRLSQRRADAVVTALVEDHGIDEARLNPVGKGMGQPVADNATDEGKAKNRRVELVKR